MASAASRLEQLIEFDVGGLLASDIRAVSELLEVGNVRTGEARLAQWERALGRRWEQSAAMLAHVRGYDGFNAAAARFARTQRIRRAEIAHLSHGIVTGEPRIIARWRWTARVYACAVHHFAIDQERRLALADAIASTRGVTGKVPLRKFPVLRANLDSRQSLLRQAQTEVERRLHNHARVGLIANQSDALTHSASILEELRNGLRDSAVRSGVDPARLSRVAGIPSLVAQIRAYHSIEREAEGEARVATARQMSDRLASGLRELNRLLVPIEPTGE